MPDFLFILADRIAEIQSSLGRALTKECANNQFIVVSFPLNVTDSNNITGMRFPEASCRATANKTHWVLKTHR